MIDILGRDAVRPRSGGRLRENLGPLAAPRLPASPVGEWSAGPGGPAALPAEVVALLLPVDNDGRPQAPRGTVLRQRPKPAADQNPWLLVGSPTLMTSLPTPTMVPPAVVAGR